MPTVAIFKETLLPPSETFILAQMNALQALKPRLVGLERTAISLPLPQSPVLLSTHSGRYADLRAKLYRRVPMAPSFHRAIVASRPQLIHAHFASGGRTILPLTQTLGLPLVVTLHGGSDVPTTGDNVGAYRKLAAEAKLFLCVSEFIRREAVKAGYPVDKLFLHYTGIDCSKFKVSTTNPNNKNILFVGRLVEMKGCEYLLRAVANVQSNTPKCRLTIIGDGPLRDSLVNLAKSLGLRSDFRGIQDATEVRRALQGTRVFCVPSVTASNGDTEGLGMVFAEAQAMGVPVVSTLHGGIPEVVADGRTGLLVPERDSESLAQGLTRLLEDDALWLRFNQAGPDHIRRIFNLQTQTVRLEEIYRAVSSGHFGSATV